MNKKIKRKIRKYAKQRGFSDPRINEVVLTKAYELASEEIRESFHKEMDDYFKAVEDGELEKGDSMITKGLRV